MSGLVLYLRYSVTGLAVVLLTSLLACHSPAPQLAAGNPLQSRATAIQEVAAAPVPPGIDAALFEQLRAQLLGLLRDTSIAPGGAQNTVTDLTLSGNGAAGYTLGWSYCNTGDYNRDGLVGVSDLTPLGIYYETAATDAAWGIARFADGNGDGWITVGLSGVPLRAFHRRVQARFPRPCGVQIIGRSPLTRYMVAAPFGRRIQSAPKGRCYRRRCNTGFP